MASEALTGGWPWPRLRGWPAPPRRVRAEDETVSEAPVDTPLEGDSGREGAAERAAPTLAPLLATATVLPPLDWAPLLALAGADQARRQAQAEEEEALLVLLMLVEEL